MVKLLSNKFGNNRRYEVNTIKEILAEEYGLGEAKITELIAKIVSVDCEPTNRLLPDWTREAGYAEWSASTEFTSPLTGFDHKLTVYYYTTAEDSAAMEETGCDCSIVDWANQIDGYEID